MNSMTYEQYKAKSRRPPTPLTARAKIFAPFDPLPGLNELLREKEKEHGRGTHTAGPDRARKTG